MSSFRDAPTPGPAAGQPHQDRPTDEFLIAGARAADDAAIRELMRRYDPLVRYTVFRTSRTRCTTDPQWLDSVAASAWYGFVRSLARRGEDVPISIRAYLVQIARFHAVDAHRAADAQRKHASAVEDVPNVADEATSDVDTVVELDELRSLRGAIGELEPEDQALLTQLSAITERRWQDAAEALNCPESTLRSRWKRLLERLRGRIGAD